MKMYSRKLLIVALAATLSLWCVYRIRGEVLPIPNGFDFPAARADLEKMRDNQDVAGMRKHAWMVFAGLTQPAPGGEAIWDTWYLSEDVMRVGAVPQGLAPKRRTFRQPRQFRGATGQAVAQAPGASLAELVLFNEETLKHNRDNNYYLRSTLDALNNQWPAGTAIKDRNIIEFPQRAMSVKTAWFLIKGTGITAMPVLDELPRKAQYLPLPPETWPTYSKRVVAVDPSREVIPADEKVTVPYQGKAFPNSKVVPLSAFYFFKLTQEMVDGLRQTAIFGDAPQAGDFLALVNFHFTTKEIPDWVWGTLWWHDKPDQGPYGAGRPDTVKGAWRNYKMDVALSMNTPQESDHTPNVVFNPWLEGRFTNGANSNCMTCHQRAVWPGQSFLPVTRGALPPDDPYFKNRTKTDFLWSLVIESKP
jgi:hypothetical protein